VAEQQETFFEGEFSVSAPQHPDDGHGSDGPEADPYGGVEFATPNDALKPAYLLADSQLLFWTRDDGRPFLEPIRDLLPSPSPLAAYIGASNGDDPAFYSIFQAAMESVGISDLRMIPAELEAIDLDFVDRAHLILLSGGEVARGWNTFVDNGLNRILQRRYQEGALLMGVSAGAVQLGLGGPDGEGKMVDTFRILPYAIGAHDEANGWDQLKSSVRHFGDHVRGFGLPTGGGLIYYPDHSLEPLRRPLVEIQAKGNRTLETLLMPGEEKAEKPLITRDEEGEVILLN
jgi:hypothetical protein